MELVLRYILVVAVSTSCMSLSLMTLIPSGYIYSIKDSKKRPSFMTNSFAWHAPMHTLSKLGRALRVTSIISGSIAGVALVIGLVYESY